MADESRRVATRRTDYPSLCRFADFVRCELRGEVECHEVLDGRIDDLKLSSVKECLFCVGYGRFQVWLGGDEMGDWGR